MWPIESHPTWPHSAAEGPALSPLMRTRKTRSFSPQHGQCRGSPSKLLFPKVHLLTLSSPAQIIYQPITNCLLLFLALPVVFLHHTVQPLRPCSCASTLWCQQTHHGQAQERRRRTEQNAALLLPPHQPWKLSRAAVMPTKWCWIHETPQQPQ